MSLLESFVKMLENSFPYADVYYHLAQNEADICRSKSMDFSEVYKVAEQMIQQIRSGGGDLSQFLKTLEQIDFFVNYPEVITKIREEYADD